VKDNNTGTFSNFLFETGRCDSLMLDWDKDYPDSGRKGVEICVADSSQIKSANIVEFDAKGNIILPSKRFESSPDIRGTLDTLPSKVTQVPLASVVPEAPKFIPEDSVGIDI